MNLYAYTGNDPVNKSDPTGKYGQGTGWDEKSWKKFDKAQQSAANRMESRAAKMEAKADKMNAKNAGSGDAMKAGATSLRGGAASLRSDGSDGKVANLKTAGDAVAAGRSAGVGAWVPGDKNIVNVVMDNTKAWGSSGMSQWTIGHESLHSTGVTLHDDPFNDGKTAYQFTDGPQKDLFNSIQGTDAAYGNPDSLMHMVYPNL